METDIKTYLKAGEQTQISYKFSKIIPVFNNSEEIVFIFNLLDFLHKRLKLDESKKEKFFRNRTAEEIFNSRFATGCSDYAIALLPLLRHNGTPARYVEAIRNKWLDQGSDDYIEGHVFVEAFLADSWYIIDPQEMMIIYRYLRHKVVDRGLDSWDIDIKDLNSLIKKMRDFKATHHRR